MILGFFETFCRILASIFIFSGLFFFITATVGVIRMPDLYNRGHVAGKGDSPGFFLTLLGIWLYELTINPIQSLKILLILFFMFYSHPIIIHAILRVSFIKKIPFMKGTTEQYLEKDKE
ncbi:MAG: monovalent cation/H(+) antiporter subunit G [bacterium]|nr:monovalent cation/H(+) antiporter subunit G [bacterium]